MISHLTFQIYTENNSPEFWRLLEIPANYDPSKFKSINE